MGPKMNPFQEKMSAWLARSGPNRALNQCFDLPIVLSTDIGLQRSENQDRVAALRINSKGSGGRPLVAVAVVDGMGGMRDGGQCATLALSSFFFALTLYRGFDLYRRAMAAIAYANDQVFKFALGKGGSTFSAVLIDHDRRPLLVNIGDSRIYSFSGNSPVERLTRDDSLAEAVGGHGRELLQFVGMGEGMQAHILPIPHNVENLALTTDGIHFIDAPVFESVLSHSPELKSVSERLAALARWCGGPDNASSAVVGLQSLLEQLRHDSDNGIEIWDASGSLIPIWIDEQRNFDDGAIAGPASLSRSELDDAGAAHDEHGKNMKTQRRSKKTKKKKTTKTEDGQFEIRIERSPSSDESDDNSR